MNFNEYLRHWNARNDESNGTLMANTAASVACLAFAVLALVVAVQLLFSPINNDRTPAASFNSDPALVTLVTMPPANLVDNMDGPSSDSSDIPDLTGQPAQDNPVNPGTWDYDNPSDPFGNEPWFTPQYPTGNGQSYDLPYTNPDENTPYYSDPQRQTADTAISVAVYGGCFTNSGRYQLVLDGLTPFGRYNAQTDWNGTGSFGYGNVNIADAYGRAVFNWSCFDATGIELPLGMYDVHFTDLSTGFGRTIGLRVD